MATTTTDERQYASVPLALAAALFVGYTGLVAARALVVVRGAPVPVSEVVLVDGGAVVCTAVSVGVWLHVRARLHTHADARARAFALALVLASAASVLVSLAGLAVEWRDTLTVVAALGPLLLALYLVATLPVAADTSKRD